MRTLGGRYQLEQRIGVGGMSEVWRGYDEVLARPVAVKLITPEQATDALSDERVRTEARSAARFVHPNVASVYDFGIAPFLPGREAPYIIMELVEGATLADHLAAGHMDWRIAVRVCAEVCAALAAAHMHGIIHRDVKPTNIMLTPSGAKVLDFGIATRAGQRDPQPDGTVLGTLAYLAPERLRGEPATPATDMYAVGVLLYQCLTGRLPWWADSPSELLRAQRYGQPEPLPPIDGLDPEIADFCTGCLGKDPKERPTSFAAALVLAEAVEAHIYVPPVGPPAPAPRPAPALRRNDRATAAARRLDLPTDRAPAPVVDGIDDERPVERPGAGHVGKHRAPTGPHPLSRDAAF